MRFKKGSKLAMVLCHLDASKNHQIPWRQEEAVAEGTPFCRRFYQLDGGVVLTHFGWDEDGDRVGHC